MWRVADYFELKALEKQQMQEGHSDLPFSSWKKEMKFQYERCSLCARRKETFLSSEIRSWSHREFVHKNLAKLTFIFIVSSLGSTGLAQAPLIFSPQFTSLCPASNNKSSALSLFSYGSFHVYEKIFSLVNCHKSIYTWSRDEGPKRKVVKFCLFHSCQTFSLILIVNVFSMILAPSIYYV